MVLLPGVTVLMVRRETFTTMLVKREWMGFEHGTYGSTPFEGLVAPDGAKQSRGSGGGVPRRSDAFRLTNAQWRSLTSFFPPVGFPAASRFILLEIHSP